MSEIGAIIELTDDEWQELNKTIHTTGWFVIQQMYEKYRQSILSHIESTGKLDDETAVLIGESRAFKKAKDLPYEKYMKYAGRKK